MQSATSNMKTHITDAKVYSYLLDNHPDVAAEFKREGVSIHDQKQHEIHMHNEATVARHNGRAESTPTEWCTADSGRPLSEVCHNVHAHWIYSVAPGLGGEEIMSLLRPCMDDNQYECLYKHAIEGRTEVAIALELGVSRWYVRCRLAEARDLVLLARPMILSNTREPRKTGFEYWKSLQQQDITIYHKPSSGGPVKVYACDCGRHLIKHKSGHLQTYKGRSKLVCDLCGKTYIESEWRGIYC